MKRLTSSFCSTLCLSVLSLFLITACAQNNMKEDGQKDMEKKQTSEQTSDSKASGKVLYRVNCAAEKDMELNGEKWLADQKKTEKNDWGANGGDTVDRGEVEIKNTELDPVYRHERYSVFGYTFNVDNGTYTVKLHFAETFPPNQYPGARLFGVNIEGENKLQNFDIYKEAEGFRTAVVKTFEGVKVEDGSLDIEFDAPSQVAINGIEIIK